MIVAVTGKRAAAAEEKIAAAEGKIDAAGKTAAAAEGKRPPQRRENGRRSGGQTGVPSLPAGAAAPLLSRNILSI